MFNKALDLENDIGDYIAPSNDPFLIASSLTTNLSFANSKNYCAEFVQLLPHDAMRNMYISKI